MKYKGKHQTKVIRSQHELRINVGGGAESLKRELSNVPDSTVLKEIIWDSDNDGIITLVFEREDVEQIKE